MASIGASLQHELPPQLADFLLRLDTKLDNLSAHLVTIEASMSRLEGRIEALETRSEQQAAEMADIRADINGLKKSAGPAPVLPNLLPSPAGSHPSDACEIFLTGLPTDVNLTDKEALDRVFTAMGLTDYKKFLVHTRAWNPKNRNKPAPDNTRAFIFKLSSPSTHDHCIVNAFKLASVNTNALFGVGDGKVRLRPLWPSETYSLLQKAYDAAQKLNLDPPIVRNLTVFMHETNGTKPIPISTEHDIRALKTRTR
ncbi:hypothetical protein TKK_0000308 [Trichogramma kaykai]|uniref:RRM domain-containing protein n=1 Tax=Trichogramma kaykai TaxID=54128 RepID=A0ABD2W845_9HYME